MSEPYINPQQRARTKWQQPAPRQQRVVVAPWPWHTFTRLPLGLTLLLLLACSSVQPVVKIGLLAPFEGLHRRTGYAALTAMRLAIQETPSTVAIIPLALDEGVDAQRAQRAAQKLLLSTEVGALIGPATPALFDAVGAVLAPSALPWYIPFAPSPPATSRLSAPSQEWLLPLLRAVAAVEAARGAQRLVVAGGAGEWPVTTALALPLLHSDQIEEVGAGDAVFWVGSAEAGAAYVHALHARPSAVPFWLGPQGDDPVFTEQAAITTGVSFVTWLDDDYPVWSQTHGITSPRAYLTYRATVQAITQINGSTAPTVPTWRIAHFTIQPDGSSQFERMLSER